MTPSALLQNVLFEINLGGAMLKQNMAPLAAL